MHGLEEELKILEENKKNCTWFSTYSVVTHLIKKYNVKSIIEIGVAYGYHCEFILNNNPEVKYLGIDPYKGNYDPKDGFAEDVKKIFNKKTQQDALDLLYNLVLKKMSVYGERFKLIRNSVENIRDEIENNTVDLIYIDGDHTYNGVIKDLNFSWEKINKTRGILCGDDYSWGSVKQACEDFFASKNLKYKIITDFGSPTHWLYKF